MTAATSTLPTVTLFCTTGGSNKEYRLFTKDNGDETFTLYYANGPIGNVGSPKVKSGPTTLALVQKEFDKTVKSKMGGSSPYTRESHGVAYSTSDAAGELSDWRPQLLNEIDDIERIVKDPRWYLQDKKNGERRGVRILDGEVRGMNKKGRFVSGLPEAWMSVLKLMPNDTMLDGEQVGDELFVFDATRIGGEDLRDRPFEYREAVLRSALAEATMPKQVLPVQLLETHVTEASKRAFVTAMQEGRGARLGEGVVGRDARGRYTEGLGDARSSDCVKFKFYEFAKCLVLRKNAGASVALGLYDEAGKVIEVGNVTIPTNQPMPIPGDVLLVRYMHKFEGGMLYGPPVSQGKVRGAVHGECLLAQVTRVMPKRGASVPVDDGDYDSEEPEVQAQRAGNDDGEPAPRERMRA